MRTSFVSVLAALISIASTVPTGYSAVQGGVAARVPSRVRSSPNFVPRQVPSGHHVARAAPSPRRRDYAAPSPRHDRRDYAPRAAPSPRHDSRDVLAPRAPHPSPRYVPRHESDHTKRSQEDQNVFGNKIEDGQGGDVEEDQCPASLSACPVRGALDADAFECVDPWSDLSSCGGCAVDDTAYDCNAIPHARSVECVLGSCEVRSCAEGYVVAPPRDVCVRVGAQ